VLAALLTTVAWAAASVRAAPPPGCPVIRSHTGNTSGDWEASFGFRALRRRAVALLDRVHAKGFRCAVIEIEQHTHEVAMIGLRTRRAAQKVVVRARRVGLRAHAVRS
jgi:hypothetical protein